MPATLLIDTYESARGLQRVIALAQELRQSAREPGVGAVRIDSGDLAAQARTVRVALDAHDCRGVRIVLSGNLDERVIEGLVAGGVPADAFGVGTALAVSADAPALDMVYKLQEYAGKPRRKRSAGKATWPGSKQVLRERAASGEYLRDRVALHDERLPGEPLLVKVMSHGERQGSALALSEIRAYCRSELRALPEAVRALAGAAGSYPVVISEAVQELARSLDRQ